MTLEAALRLSEGLLAFAIVQSSAEHLPARRAERGLFALRLALGVLLGLGLWPELALLGLCMTGFAALWLFQGPYNGGSDRMGLLILLCLTAAHFLPGRGAELAFGYLAAQTVLSYFMSGWVKLRNPAWRSGQALGDVFAFSAYPVSEGLRGLATRPALLLWASRGVIGAEVAFPLALLSGPLLASALALMAAFHLANACLFGLNRFFWTWIAAYPSILWLQGRLLGDVW